MNFKSGRGIGSGFFLKLGRAASLLIVLVLLPLTGRSQDDGEHAPPGPVATPSATVYVTNPGITLAETFHPVSLGTTDVVIGELGTVTATISPAQIANGVSYAWTVQGTVDKKYTAHTGKLIPYAPSTNSSTGEFFWVAGAFTGEAQQVTVASSRSGVALSVPATLRFTVWSPRSTFPKLPMGVAMLETHDGVQNLHIDGNAQGHGVTFKPTVTTPTLGGHLLGGKYAVNQIVTPVLTGTDRDGIAVHDANSGLGAGLDNTFQYADYNRAGGGQPIVWNADTANPRSTGDSPGSPLNQNLVHSVTTTEAFDDTLMYLYGNINNSCWVPLLLSTWNWTATATFTTAGGWQITDPTPANVKNPFDTQTAGVPSTTFPSWKRKHDNVTLVKWVK